ncbi:MAG: DEAD/DEAH box helicase [Actinomycetota bacterium]|nr:DEAD/DEAH box helicase [Actinomycetota bacterium]
MSAPVVATLRKRGVEAPFKIQALVIADAIAGRDVLAKSRTGSGKTLAFALPIIERIDRAQAAPAALVLVPTRELAVQVTEEFSDIAAARGLRVASVYGGVGLQDQAKRAARAHILVATPGRLEDLIRRRLVTVKTVRILVLDEADRMLDMGFQPQVDRIVDRLPQDRQTMFFSATLDGQVGYLARAYTKTPAQHEVVDPKQTVEEADHLFVPVTTSNKVDRLVELVEGAHGLALVFVRTKRGADRLAHKLKARNIPAVAMHGDLTQAAREKALSRFESGKVGVLIATDVAARGLDLDDISHVINFDPPEDDKGYVHRVGRTARAGRSGTGVTLVLPDQRHDVSRIAARLKLATEFEASGMPVAPPAVVFSSRGRRSSMRPRVKRRI